MDAAKVPAASGTARSAGTNAEGTAQRRDLSLKAWSHEAAAIERLVSGAQQWLQKLALVSAHEILTLLTETQG